MSTFVSVVFRNAITFHSRIHNVGWKQDVLNNTGCDFFRDWVLHSHFQDHVNYTSGRVHEIESLRQSNPEICKKNIIPKLCLKFCIVVTKSFDNQLVKW